MGDSPAARRAPPFLSDLGPDKGQAVLDAVQAGPVDKRPADIADRTIQGGPSGQVSIRIVRPQRSQGSQDPSAATATLPVIVHIHGGGWVLGNEHTHGRYMETYCPVT